MYIYIYTHTRICTACMYLRLLAITTRRSKVKMHSTDVWNEIIVMMVYHNGTCFRYALFGKPERLRASRACGNQCVRRGFYWIRQPGNHDKCTAWIPMGACG